MALRASSLQSTNTLAINREIGSQYDVILEVSKHLAEIDTLANEDISGLIDSLNDAKDFTGITVVTGETPSWDAANKILTVPVEKGDAGENGRGITNIELTSTTGLTKTYAINYTDGTSSTFTVVNGANGTNGAAGKSTYQLWLDAGNEGTLNDFLAAMRGPVGPIGPVGVGVQGEKGDAGQDLTIEQIVYNSDGTFTWHFSDETTYTTPNLKGPKGDKGDVGLTGLQGISVHHIKGTSTTDLEGDFASYGETDTYTLYGDAAETINLGYFRVNNGLAKEGQVGVMFRSTYDTDNSGVVDNAEKLNGLTAQEIQRSITDLYGQPNGIATLDGTGLIPAEQLPSYVDDVLEVSTYADLPVIGESSKIYVVITDETLGNNTSTYRWSGSMYVLISDTMNASDIKVLYESNLNTNEFNDVEKSLVDYTTSLNTAAMTFPTAINEIKSGVDTHVNKSVDAHQSSSISNSAGANVYATGNNVEVAIAQLDLEAVTQGSKLSIIEGDSSTIGSIDQKIVTQSELANYTNTNSGLLATTLKEAIDELANEVIVEVHTLYSELPTTGLTNRLYVVTSDETSDNNSSTYIWNNGVYELVTNMLTSTNIQNMYESQSDKVLEDTNMVGFSTDTALVAGVGQAIWNIDESTVDIGLNTEVTLQVGQEHLVKVRNGSATTIGNGKVVMAIGTTGNSGRVLVDLHDGTQGNSKRVIGITTQSIESGADGFVTQFGKIRNIDTTGSASGEVWVNGDILYVKPNDAGHLTKVVPIDSELGMPVAFVVNAHTNGTLFVRVTGVDENMIAKRADKWTTARTITLDGDVAGSVSVDGSADVTITTTVQPNSIELGTDTTGNYMADVVAGNGISISHTQGEGSTATITNSAPNVTTDITTTHTPIDVVVNSSDGTDGTINSATQTLAGVMSAADKTKLDGIEAGATGDQTASEILTLLKTVDGSGSGVDADLLDGQEGAYYLNASNINTGTINDSYLPDTITSDITGNAATATKLATARTISLTGDVTGDVSFDGSANVSITTTVADDSHNHVISNVDGLQDSLDSKANQSTTYTKVEVDNALALKVDDTEIASVNLLRADKYLASQNIANMLYTDGNLSKIRYNNDIDVNYETFGYTLGNLTSINHYVGSVFKGTTTLSYTDGNLVSAIFVGV